MSGLSKKPIVSIIIPVFNAEAFLNEVFDSVRAQSYQDFEVIFVDDCSTDGSVEVLKAIQRTDQRFSTIFLPINEGAAKARNIGVEAARGRYLAFLDSDDLWHPEKLEKQLALMRDMSSTFTFTGYIFTDAKGRPSGAPISMPETITYQEALGRSPIFTSTTMFDLEKIDKHDLRMPDLKIGEDTLTWWTILRKYGPAHSINEPLVYYRRSAGTLSSNKFEALVCRWRMYREFEKLPLLASSWYFRSYILDAVRRRTY